MFSGNGVACGLCRFSVLQILFLEVLNRVVSIFAGIVGSLVGITTLTEKYKSYINRRREQTEKDPSACLPASDGSSGDCVSNR